MEFPIFLIATYLLATAAPVITAGRPPPTHSGTPFHPQNSVLFDNFTSHIGSLYFAIAKPSGLTTKGTEPKLNKSQA